MKTEKEKNLCYLEELSDYKVKDNDKDVRGWKVKDKDGKTIGTVDNLLVNKTSERVVYLDVEVDKSIIEANHQPYRIRAEEGVHEFLNEDGENHVIIPIGLAHLDLAKEYVFTERIDHKTFAETKRIKKGTPIDRDYEVLVLANYDRDQEDQDRNQNVVYPKDNSFYDRIEFCTNS